MGWGKILVCIFSVQPVWAQSLCAPIFAQNRTSTLDFNQLPEALKPNWLRFERLRRKITSDQMRIDPLQSELFRVSEMGPVALTVRTQKIARYLNQLEHAVEAHNPSWARHFKSTRRAQIKNQCALGGDHAL